MSPGIRGAYDVHLHASPDVVDRSLDFLDAATAAADAGLAGLVFKDLSDSTVDRAYAVRKLHPSLKAYGGIVLDTPIGGLNPAAVDRCLRKGGRVIWMPVVDARHMVRRYALGKVRLPVPPRLTESEALSVLDQDGALLPEVREILQLVADHDAVVATGHLAPDESLALLEAASRTGVQRMLVNHPLAHTVSASLNHQRRLVELGAVIEYCAAQCTPGLDALPIRKVVEAVGTLGPEHCVLASDLGQTFNPPFVDGLRAFVASLSTAGIPAMKITQMTCEVPNRLLE